MNTPTPEEEAQREYLRKKERYDEHVREFEAMEPADIIDRVNRYRLCTEPDLRSSDIFKAAAEYVLAKKREGQP